MIYLAFLLAALAQISVFSALEFFDTVPNFVLIVMVLWLSGKSGKTGGVLAVIVGGLLLDLFSNEILGVNTIALLAAFFFIRWVIVKSVRYDNVIILSLMMLTATFIFNTVRILVVYFFVSGNDLLATLGTLKFYVFNLYLKESFYNIIILNLLILAGKFRRSRKKIKNVY